MTDGFEKTFEKLTHTQDPTRIFDEFLDYCIDINLFQLEKQELDFKGREEQYMTMFQEWIFLTNEKLSQEDTIGWYDYLGEFYESVIQSKFKAGNIGQFFTPSNVCETMAQMTIMCKPSNGMINDCCCGSGRLLLAGHNHDPNAIVIGQDLDSVSVKMAALNFYIHGVRGSVLHMNSITNEFFGGYKVNQYLGYGLPNKEMRYISKQGKQGYRVRKTRNYEVIWDCIYPTLEMAMYERDLLESADWDVEAIGEKSDGTSWKMKCPIKFEKHNNPRRDWYV